jgi:hypothetical protein
MVEKRWHERDEKESANEVGEKVRIRVQIERVLIINRKQ